MSHPPNPSVVIQLLSPERMARYRTNPGGWGKLSDAETLSRYEVESRRQAKTWTFIGGVEVILRNALHTQLAAKYGEWYSNPDFCDLLEEHDYLRLEEAWTNCENAQARRWSKMKQRDRDAAEPPIEPGHMVAELSFGFWRKLLSRSYDRHLWTPALHNAFLPGKRSRDSLYLAANRLNIQRNRIAHHERIGPTQQIQQDGLTIAGAISPDGQAWVASLLKSEPTTPAT